MIGELAALSAAGLWAIASITYARLGLSVSPLLLNLGKGIVAIALVSITLLLTGQSLPTGAIPAITGLLLSGSIGIGIGDTFYFEALRRLGVRQVLLLGILSPPLTAILAMIFLREVLPVRGLLGIGITLIGISWVITERTPADLSRPTQQWQGIGFALLALLGNSAGALLARNALSTTDVSPLWGALLRLLGGLFILVGWIGLSPKLRAQLAQLTTFAVMRPLSAAAFMGTYLGIWLQQVSLKYTAAGIAQTLSATGPVFILILETINGKVVSRRAWLGTAIALGGIFLLLVPR
jgi:drug/metabolite transporter (DMT)-like permease